MKRTLVAVGVLLLLVIVGSVVWARAILATDPVRRAMESQLTAALGEPVAIGRVRATVFPRITVSLGDVRIGNPVRITINTLGVGAAPRALWSRRIERGSLHVSGARVTLPLPTFAASTSAAASQGAPLTLVSIDDITLTDLVLEAGGRSLAVSAALALDSDGLRIRSATLQLADTTLTIEGLLRRVNGPEGSLTVKADTMNILGLVEHVGPFVAGATAQSDHSGDASAPPVNLTVDLQAERASLGPLLLGGVTGTAHVTREGVRLDPVAFAVLGGRYAGTLGLSLGAVPTYHMRASLAELDMPAVMALVAQPGLITGQLSGTLDIAGRGTTVAAITTSTHGRADLTVTNGTVARLGLVRTIVLATAMREDSRAASNGTSSSEAFTRLTGSYDIANSEARTTNLRFESPDLTVTAAGRFRLDGDAVDLTGRAQLSEALSKQAGRDLYRYAQEDGRVTLPLRVTGPASNLDVRVAVADAARRAILNRGAGEAADAIKRGLDRLLGR